MNSWQGRVDRQASIRSTLYLQIDERKSPGKQERQSAETWGLSLTQLLILQAKCESTNQNAMRDVGTDQKRILRSCTARASSSSDRSPVVSLCWSALILVIVASQPIIEETEERMLYLRGCSNALHAE